MTRWVNTRGQKGPWSEIAMATVAASDVRANAANNPVWALCYGTSFAT